MISEFDLFGAIEKEAPQLTRARSILGVGRAADKDEIKKIYRKYMKEFHPDLHQGKPTEKEAQQKIASLVKKLSAETFSGKVKALLSWGKKEEEKSKEHHLVKK